MKKIGYFFSGFLPILTTTAAQILASFFMFGIAALFLCPASQSTGFDADTIETLLTNRLWLKPRRMASLLSVR